MMNNYFTRYYYTLRDLLRDTNADRDVYFGNAGHQSEFDRVYTTIMNISDMPIDLAGIEADNLWVEYIVPHFLKSAVGYLDHSPETQSELDEVYEDFMIKYLSKLRETLPKYKTVINIYNEQEAHLMDAIKSQTSGSGSNTQTNSGDTTLTDTFNTDVKNTGTVENAATGRDKNTEGGTTTLKKTLDQKTSNLYSDTPQDEAWAGDTPLRGFMSEANKTIISGDPEDLTVHGKTDEIQYGKTDTRTDNTNQTQTGTITHKNDLNTTIANIGSNSNMTLDEKESIINRINDIKNKWDNLYKEWRDEFTELFITL